MFELKARRAQGYQWYRNAAVHESLSLAIQQQTSPAAAILAPPNSPTQKHDFRCYRHAAMRASSEWRPTHAPPTSVGTQSLRKNKNVPSVRAPRSEKPRKLR